jgi:hypothetical protein
MEDEDCIACYDRFSGNTYIQSMQTSGVNIIGHHHRLFSSEASPG